MRVSPANLYPEMTKSAGGKVVIINLQKTPLDELCDLVIHEKIDTVIELLMSKLQIEIPRFRQSNGIAENFRKSSSAKRAEPAKAAKPAIDMA